MVFGILLLMMWAPLTILSSVPLSLSPFPLENVFPIHTHHLLLFNPCLHPTQHSPFSAAPLSSCAANGTPQGSAEHTLFEIPVNLVRLADLPCVCGDQGGGLKEGG